MRVKEQPGRASGHQQPDTRRVAAPPTLESHTTANTEGEFLCVSDIFLDRLDNISLALASRQEPDQQSFSRDSSRIDCTRQPCASVSISLSPTTMAARDFPTIKAIRSYVIGGVGSGENEMDKKNALPAQREQI